MISPSPSSSVLLCLFLLLPQCHFLMEFCPDSQLFKNICHVAPETSGHTSEFQACSGGYERGPVEAVKYLMLSKNMPYQGVKAMASHVLAACWELAEASSQARHNKSTLWLSSTQGTITKAIPIPATTSMASASWPCVSTRSWFVTAL